MQDLDRPWPPTLPERKEGVRYPFYAIGSWRCSCGSSIHSMTITKWEPEIREFPHGPRFTHGSNREAVLEIDFLTDWTVELEKRMAEWANHVHDYQARGQA